VNILCVFNLLALAVIALRVRRPPTSSTKFPSTASLLALLWCFGLLVAYPLAAWLEVPALRVYSSHNMMQLDACYQVANLPSIPQEWDLAGLRLNYGWLGLIQLTAISWFLDCSPTLVFPWLSALQLLALVVLVNETARQLGADHPFLTASAVAAIVLGTNLVGMVSVLSYGPSFLQGEMRTTAFIGKYLGIDTMVIGLALAAGLVYTIALGATVAIERVWLLIPLVLLGIGLSYPLLLPSTLLLAGLYGCFIWARTGAEGPRYSRGTLWLLLAGSVGAVAVTGLYLQFLSEGRPMHALQLANRHVLWTNLKFGGSCIGLLFVVAYPTILSGWRHGTRPIQLLTLGALFCSILYLVSSMPGRVQYKHLFTAVICLAPIAAVPLVAGFARLGRGSIICALGTLLAVESLSSAYFWKLGRPRELSLGIPVDESRFHIHVTACADDSWLEAIRTKTAPDTLLIFPDSPLPVSTLTQRASLVAAEPPGVYRVGHGQPAELALLGIKGYPRPVYSLRQDLRSACYQETADFARLTADLRGFHHPLAIVFDRHDASYLAWLKSHDLGSSVAQNSSRIVWLLPADERAHSTGKELTITEHQ